jgi:hypothetical protein
MPSFRNDTAVGTARRVPRGFTVFAFASFLTLCLCWAFRLARLRPDEPRNDLRDSRLLTNH